MSHSVVFLDRDGTLIEDGGYVHRIEDYALLPGAAEALRLLRDGGFRIALVTNQSGIGRGYYGEPEFARFQEHLERDLASKGAAVDAVYHCPHRPDEGCACRKPAAGMIEQAQRDLGADLATSWVVGDSPTDVGLARGTGCSAVYVLTGQGAARLGEIPEGVPVVDDVLAAARHILAQVEK